MDLGRFPRRKYTAHPTPIEPMPVLSGVLSGGDVHLWIKRDDQTGLVGGGNKTRKLEFVMADAIKQGADTVVTTGAVQSNHCRLTLSACNKERLSCCLVLEERVPDSYQQSATGNNYLFHLLGAEKIVKVGLGEGPAAAEKMAAELRSTGRKVYCIPGGASNELGATGYCACAAEIQVRRCSLCEPSCNGRILYNDGFSWRNKSVVSFSSFSTSNSPNNCLHFIPWSPHRGAVEHILDSSQE